MGLEKEKEELREMFRKYRSLESHLEEQKDSKGIELMFDTVKSASAIIKFLIEYNHETIQHFKQIIEAESNDDES